MADTNQFNNPNNPNFGNNNPQIPVNNQANPFGINNSAVNSGFNPNNPTIPAYQDFAPQQAFDTAFVDPNYNPNNPQLSGQPNNTDPNSFVPYNNDQYNPQLNDYANYPINDQPIEQFEEELIQEKPKNNTKKILIFGLIGLMVILLVASVALYVINANNTNSAPASTPIRPAVTQKTPVVSSITPKSETTATTPKSVTKVAKTVADPSTPAGKAIVNAGALKLPKAWVSENFKSTAGALSADGTCKILTVCSEKADPDNDGASNLEEYIYATNPNLADTDSDGISDGDEIHTYFSNPKSKDSDSDTFPDGSEIANCYDPNQLSKIKMDSFRLGEISSQANSNPLHKETKDTLTKAGATSDDLEKGYIAEKCGTTAMTKTPSSELSNPITSTKPTTANDVLPSSPEE